MIKYLIGIFLLFIFMPLILITDDFQTSKTLKMKEQPKFQYYCKQSYDWCIHNCIRHISRSYGMIKDYDNCNKYCEILFGKHYKKFDNLFINS